MGKNLKDILNSNPPYYMGLQPLAQNIMSRIILKYNHINWIDSDIFHDASINGDFNKFFSACDGKNIILVAPDYMIGLNKFIKTITKHIIIPSVNCWLSKDKILKKINEYLKGRNVKHIILFSSSMMSNILIDNLYKEYGEIHSFLNMGSVFDPFLGRKTRKYHLKLDCKRTLFAITTFNQIQYTRGCLNSLNNSKVRNMDIVIFDDHSRDKTINLDKEYDIKIITKSKGKGLTDSWNMAFRYFDDYDYDYFFLINNDVLIPAGALEQMIILLENNSLVVPMTTLSGAGDVGKLQSMLNYHNITSIKSQNDIQRVQDEIQTEHKLSIELPRFNGFFLGMNRNIKEFRFSNEYFFNPKNINVGNDDEFNARIKRKGEKAILCTKAFIYHFKDISFNVRKYGVNRNNLEFYRNVK
ncbi:hypothetical protein ES703_44269 [subsurface metagenome]